MTRRVSSFIDLTFMGEARDKGVFAVVYNTHWFREAEANSWTEINEPVRGPVLKLLVIQYLARRKLHGHGFGGVDAPDF